MDIKAKNKDGFYEYLKKRISIGWNQDPAFYDRIIVPYNQYITEIFFAPPLSLEFDNAREHYMQLDFSTYRAELVKIKTNYPHISLNLLYNFYCMGENTDEASLEKLAEIPSIINAGIDMISVSNLMVAEHIMEKLPHMKLHLSVKLNIDTYENVRYIAEKYGEDRIYCINIGRNAVYDFELLKKLKRDFKNIKYKIILNEFCTHRCLDSDLHSQMKTHHSYNRVNRLTCASYTRDTWWRFFTGQGIIPRDISEWFGLVDIFKISSRWLKTEAIKHILYSYLTGEDTVLRHIIYTFGQGGTWFKKNKELIDSLDLDKPYPENFFKMRSRCSFNCTECGYCQKIASEYFIK